MSKFIQFVFLGVLVLVPSIVLASYTEKQCSLLMKKLEPFMIALDEQVIKCETQGCSDATIAAIKEQFQLISEKMSPCNDVLANQG